MVAEIIQSRLFPCASAKRKDGTMCSQGRICLFSLRREIIYTCSFSMKKNNSFQNVQNLYESLLFYPSLPKWHF